jgi:hypothetical protein
LTEVDAGLADDVNGLLLELGRLAGREARQSGEPVEGVCAYRERVSEVARAGTGRCRGPDELREDRGVGLDVRERQ